MDNTIAHTQPEYISVDEAAALLGTNRRQIKKMIATGKLRAKNINATGTKREIHRVLREDVLKPDNI